jgi:hypothetical protein
LQLIDKGKNMHNRLNMLIDDDFCLLVWDDRNGRGVWAGLSPFDTTFEKFKNYTSNQSQKFHYLASTCVNVEWLPLALGNSLELTLSSLDQKLNGLPIEDHNSSPDSIWHNAVKKSILRINDAIDGNLLYNLMFPDDYHLA